MVPDEWLGTVNTVGDMILLLSGLSQLAILAYFVKILTLDSKGLYFDIQEWPQEVKQRIMIIYSYLAYGLVLLVTTALCACNSSMMKEFVSTHSFFCSICMTFGLFLSMVFLHNFPYESKFGPKLFFFTMHSMLSAPSMCTLGFDVCTKSLMYLLQLLVIITLLSLLADKDFHKKLTGPLAKVNGIILASSICVSIIGTPKNWFEIALLCINIHIGLIFFSWMYIVNTQMLILHSKEECDNFDPIYIAAIMEINILNLYMRLATFTTLTLALVIFQRSTGTKGK